ncbi:MAG: universal stress protein [Myxococcales bacterium]|nr:universal stress protein [Myxococcales bacterium]
MALITKILIPVDFSASCRAAAEYGLKLAAQFGAEVDLLHVWDPPSYIGPEVMISVPGGTSAALRDYVREEAQAELERFSSSLAVPDGVTVSTHLQGGDARLSILSQLEDVSYDLLIMGTHGRKGLSRFFLGSVTEYVLRRAACPVLTIRHPEE